MKNLVLLFFFGFCVTCFSQNAPFRRLGQAFIQTNVPVVWNAPRNGLPRKFWVYRASPAKVFPAIISNLVALGSFTDKDQKKIPDNLHFISYADQTGKRALMINTEWAFIHYFDTDANDMHITNGVPNRQQAFEMAEHWLPKLGIDARQLFQNPKGAGTRFYGGAETVFFYPREGGPAFATNTCSYNVTFFRALDGIKFSGGCAHGGGEIVFGHDAKISDIMVSWRNYKRDKRYPTASTEILLKWIHEGKVVWWPSDDSPLIDWRSVKKIVITKVTPYYYSEAYDENDKPQNTAYPFAEMEALADTGTTNLTFYFDCPIIDEAKP